MERKVLLSIEIENEQAIKQAAVFKQAIEQLKKEQQELKKSLAEGRISADDYAQALVKNEASIRANQKSLRDLNRTIDLNIKAANEQEGSYNSLSAQYSLLKDQINAMGAAEGEELEMKQALEQQANDLYNEMKRLQEATGKYTLSVGDYRNALREVLDEQKPTIMSLETMRARLQELENLASKVDVGSTEFREANDEAQNLRLSIDQALGKVNEFGEREPKNPVKKSFEDAFAAAGALTSGIQLLSVAMGDNDDIAKLQAKSLQAIAIAQNVTNVVKEKGAIIDTAILIRTKAVTAAQRLWTLAIGSSTGAMKALRVALISTGIGALVVGIGLLIANFKEVNGFIDKIRQRLRDFIQGIVGSEEAAKWLAFSLELIISPLSLIISGINELGKVLGFVKVQKLTTDIDALNSALERSEAAFERQNRKLQDNIALLKASGANAETIANKEIELLDKRAAQWNSYDKRVQQHVQNILASGRQLTDEEQKALDDFNKKVADANLALAVKEAEVRKERLAKAKERSKELTDIERELNNEIEALLIAGIRNQFDRRVAEIENRIRLEREATALRIEELRKAGKLTEAIQKELNDRLTLIEKQAAREVKQVNDERLKAELEYQKQAEEIKKEQYENSLAGRFEALNKQLELEQQYLQQTAILTATTEAGRLQQHREFARQELELQKKLIEDKIKILLEYTKSVGFIGEAEQQQLTALKDQLAGIVTEIQNILNNNGSLASALGVTPEQIGQIQEGIAFVSESFGQLSDLINAAYQTRLNEVAVEYDAREQAIRNSTKSEKAKEKELEKLRRERAIKEWKIQKEQFEANQATQIVQAIINGAQAAIAAFATPDPTLGVYTAIRLGLIAATTAESIATIASQQPPPKPQFFDGGFTEQSGNPRMRSSKASNQFRDVHHNEYVVPWKVLSQPQAMPLVHTLESMRLNTPGRIGISGFADGGFTARSIRSNAMNNADIANAVVAGISNVKIVTRISDINRVQSDTVQNRTMAEL